MEVTIIKNKASKYLLFASILTILIMFNNSRVFANEVLFPKGYIDTPLDGATIKGDVAISGWFLDSNGVTKVEVLIDGKIMGEAQYGIPRADVGQAFPEYQNGNSGYQFTLNTKNLTNGQHSLTIRETGNNRATTELKSQINVQNAASLASIGSIDEPVYRASVKGEIAVRGWFLDESSVSKIEILIDGKRVGEAQYGIPRLDVQKAYPDYQNANSGYLYTLNTKNLTNGQHKLTVKETGNNGATSELNSLLDIQNLPAKGSIDEPVFGSSIQGETLIRGWFLDANGVSKIEVLVDGKSMGNAMYGVSRTDVEKVFPEYQNANSGYQFTLNTKNLTNGLHKLTIRETGNNGAINILESQISVQNLPSIGSIDEPVSGASISGDSTVRGWFLDPSGVSKIEVLVDGKFMGEAQYGNARPDVVKAFPAYQNANSGYQFTLNTKNLANGQHKLTVKAIGKNGTTNILESQVNVQNLPAIGSIDEPAINSSIKEESTIRGWFLDPSGVSKLEVLVDGKKVGEAQYGSSRSDVAKVFPQYQNANSGYQYNLNTKNLTNGQHRLIVRETGNNGVVNELESLFNVQNLPVIGYIDLPGNNSSVKGDVSVSGWFLDLSGVSKLEVFVDGKNMGEAQYGSARPDVAQAFSDYQNGNSGYQFIFNSLQFADGQHTLTVKETGGNGSTNTVNSIIYIYNGNPYLQIDLRKPANITAIDIIAFFNKKRPDSPLKNYAQSFIDTQNKYGVNAQYLVAHAIWETGWDGSNLRNYKHNLYGYSAYDVCPFTCGYYFPTGGDSINFEGYIVRRDYLNENGSFYNGPTLTGMNVRYATDPNWANGIANLMQSIKPFDAESYFQSSVLPSSSVPAPSFGRDIPSNQPYPTSIVINNTADIYATVINGAWSLRSIPYVSNSTFIKYVSSGTIVKVLGYNTDVKYVPGDSSKYPYDNRWYRVLMIDGQEGWLYGGGIAFN